MRWTPATIHRFATEAGFTRPDVHTAVAIALAASGGHDTFDHRCGIPCAGRYVGLWGIDAVEHPDLPYDLHDPRDAAKAAYALTQEAGGFGWSAHWRAGHHAQYREVARTHSGHVPFHEREYAPVTSTLLAHREHELRQLAARLNRGAPWPTRSR